VPPDERSSSTSYDVILGDGAARAEILGDAGTGAEALKEEAGAELEAIEAEGAVVMWALADLDEAADEARGDDAGEALAGDDADEEEEEEEEEEEASIDLM